MKELDLKVGDKVIEVSIIGYEDKQTSFKIAKVVKVNKTTYRLDDGRTFRKTGGEYTNKNGIISFVNERHIEEYNEERAKEILQEQHKLLLFKHKNTVRQYLPENNVKMSIQILKDLLDELEDKHV